MEGAESAQDFTVSVLLQAKGTCDSPGRGSEGDPFHVTFHAWVQPGKTQLKKREREADGISLENRLLAVGDWQGTGEGGSVGSTSDVTHFNTWSQWNIN